MASLTDVNGTETCKVEKARIDHFRRQLPQIADLIIANCNDTECYTHVADDPIPTRESVVDIVNRFIRVIFPGYFNPEKLDPINMKYSLGKEIAELFNLLADQICLSIRHDCLRYGQPCSKCAEQGHESALKLIADVPLLRKQLAQDVRAAFDGDPAAQSYDEIIFSYPGVFAITVHRIANRFYKLGIPLLPRIMSEHAHGHTGIDIHPGADIGERFMIDHGTGVVIGETTRIGRNVRIYQGVTLGALSLPRGAGQALKGQKRHPTIEDDVIIYAGATILGGETTIGKASVIGGNVWITESIPAGTTVIMETPRLIYKQNGQKERAS